MSTQIKFEETSLLSAFCKYFICTERSLLFELLPNHKGCIILKGYEIVKGDTSKIAPSSIFSWSWFQNFSGASPQTPIFPSLLRFSPNHFDILPQFVNGSWSSSFLQSTSVPYQHTFCPGSIAHSVFVG